MKQGRWAAAKTLIPYLESLVLVLAASMLGQPLRSSVHPTNLVMFYLVSIVFVALRYGLGPSIVTAACSVLAFNFFYVPPLFTFDFSDLEYALTFLGLLVVGGVLSTVAGKLRNQAKAARQREDETAALYALSQELTVATQMPEVIQAAVAHIDRVLHSKVQIVLSDNFEQFRGRPDFEIIQWVYQKGVAAGPGTPHFSRSNAHYYPLKTPNATLGVVVFSPQVAGDLQAQTLHRALVAYTNLIALAVERIQLVDKAQQAELLAEKERLQSAVLSSISHDLRTPLVSITGALSSMVCHRDSMDWASQEELLLNAWNEARRLNRLVANLLDMSRLTSKTVQTSFDYCDIQDLIGVALSDVENRSEKRRITVDVAENVPLVRLDFTLFERVLVNVLDNALKYSQPDTPIELTVRRADPVVRIQVADRGRGIPAADLPHIFERFYRAHTAQPIEGAGLGLAICKGVVELHGGQISAFQRPGGGTIIQIDLPLSQACETTDG